MSNSVVFFGNERIATGVSTDAPTLRALINAGYDVKAVVSNYEEGTSRKSRKLEIKEIAEQHGIPVLLPNKPKDIIDELRSFNAEVAVLVAYGRIVPQSIINIFPRGIVNIHPSLLPLHRGPTPLESVILNGERVTGVSVMALAKEMDAGPVYGQTEATLNGDETKQTLADTLIEIGSEMIIELLPGIISGDIVAIPQDNENVTYDRLLTKEDGLIDWKKSADQLEREVRAFAEWPKSKTVLAGKEVIITDAHAVSTHQQDTTSPGDIAFTDQVKGFGVTTSNGILHIDTLKPAGKNEMTSEAFLAGHKDLRK